MRNNNSTTSWIILIGLVLVWGSSFILIKKSLIYFDAVEVGLLRVTITFILLLPFAIKRLRRLNRKLAGYLIITGLVSSLIPAILFAIAQTKIDSSLAGTLNSLTPLFTLILGVSLFKLKTRWYNIIGVLIGLIGAIGLIYASSEQGFVLNMKYALLIVAATICYAFSVNFIKIYLKELDALSITIFTFFFVGIPSLVYVLIFTDVPSKLMTDSESLIGLGYLSILAIVGTGLALIAFNKLIKISSPVFASSVTYLIPVVAILWGIIDGEIFKPAYVIWFLMIVIGVLLVNTSPNQRMNIGSMIFFRGRK